MEVTPWESNLSQVLLLDDFHLLLAGLRSSEAASVMMEFSAFPVCLCAFPHLNFPTNPNGELSKHALPTS